MEISDKVRFRIASYFNTEVENIDVIEIWQHILFVRFYTGSPKFCSKAFLNCEFLIDYLFYQLTQSPFDYIKKSTKNYIKSICKKHLQLIKFCRKQNLKLKSTEYGWEIYNRSNVLVDFDSVILTAA